MSRVKATGSRPRCAQCGGLKANRSLALCNDCSRAEHAAQPVPRGKDSVGLRWRIGTAIVRLSDWLDGIAFDVRKTGHRFRMKGRE